MEDKIVLKVPRKTRYKSSGVIRIIPEAEEVLQRLSDSTGLSVRFIASEMILQGEKLIKIEEE